MPINSYYEVLGLPATATEAEIKAAYRRLSRRVHPDSNGTNALFQLIQEAYATLSDPGMRADYDRRVRQPLKLGAHVQGVWTSDWDLRDERQHQRGAGYSRGRPPPPGRWREDPMAAPPEVAKRRRGMRFVLVLVVIVALVGLDVGAYLGRTRGGLIALGIVAMLVAVLAALGVRRLHQGDLYHRSGMTAVDGMTHSEFTHLLELLFIEKDFRVAAVGSRHDSSVDLVLDSFGGRTVVQVKHGANQVRHGAIQQVISARVQYDAGRALVISSSDFSDRAIALARSSNVTLWDRSALARELSKLSNPARISPTKRFSHRINVAIHCVAGGLMAYRLRERHSSDPRI